MKTFLVRTATGLEKVEALFADINQEGALMLWDAEGGEMVAAYVSGAWLSFVCTTADGESE